MDLGPWEKLAAAVAAGIVAILGALRARASRRRSAGRILLPPQDQEVRVISRVEYQELDARARQGEQAQLEVVELRVALLKHVEEDRRAHIQLGSIEQALAVAQTALARAERHADESSEGYERLAKVEAALAELRRYADALNTRIEREHVLIGEIRKEDGFTQERLAVLEVLSGARKQRRGGREG